MVPHNDLQCLGGDAGIDESMSTAAADIVGASVFSALRRSRVVRAAILGAWGLTRHSIQIADDSLKLKLSAVAPGLIFCEMH